MSFLIHFHYLGLACLHLVCFVSVSPVNGNWSQWSPWQPCSVTCGGGNRTRNRACTEPRPKWEGKDCIGMNVSSEECNQHKCNGKVFSRLSLDNMLQTIVLQVKGVNRFSITGFQKQSILAILDTPVDVFFKKST